MKAENSSGRIEYVDAAKAIAILLVVFAHCHWINVYPRLANFIYSFHMPLFFILSGFFIKSLGWKTAGLKYARSYLWPYMVIMLLMIGTDFIADWRLGGSYANSIGTGLLRMVYCNPYVRQDVLLARIPGVGPAWFLFALFWGCFIYSIASRRFKSFDVLFLITAFMGLAVFSARKIQFPFELQAGMVASFYVGVGRLVHDFQVVNRVTGMNRIVWLIVIISFLLLSNMGRVALNISYLGGSVAGMICSVVGSLAVLCICRKYSYTGGWVGRNTLYVLAGHMLMQQITMALGFSYECLPYYAAINLCINALTDIGGALLLGYLLSLTQLLQYSKLFKNNY